MGALLFAEGHLLASMHTMVDMAQHILMDHLLDKNVLVNYQLVSLLVLALSLRGHLLCSPGASGEGFVEKRITLTLFPPSNGRG